MTVLVLAQTDARLAQPVDLRLKIAPLDEAVAAMGKAAGIEMSAGNAVREMKITVLVDGMPVGRVMARVADAMRLQWEKTGDGYRLVYDAAAVSREAAFLNHEAESRRKGIEAQLRDQAEAAGTPYLGIHDAYEAAQKVFAAMKSDDPKREGAIRRMNTLAAMQGRDAWLQGRMLRGLGAAGWRRLMAGETVAASTNPGPGGIALPVAALGYPQWMGSNEEEVYRNRSSRIDLFVKIDPETGEIAYRSTQIAENGNGAGMSRGTSGGNGAYDAGSYETAFWKEITGWEQQKPEDPAMALRCDPKTPERPSVWWTGYYGLDDRLEWLHDAAKIPIVAMASRKPSRTSTLRFDGTVAQWIENSRTKSFDGAMFRAADGFLMARPYEFWRRRREEPTEAVLRRLERTEAPTIDDYADFVARVTNRQAKLAGSTYDFLLRVSPYALDDGLPALRLWAALSPVQRQALRREGAVPYGALSGPARVAYAGALSDPFGGGWHNGGMSARMTGSAPLPLAAWGVIGQTNGVQASGRGRPEPLDRDYSKPYEYVQEPATGGIRLLLGPSVEDAVSYTLPLAGQPKKR